MDKSKTVMHRSAVADLLSSKLAREGGSVVTVLPEGRAQGPFENITDCGRTIMIDGLYEIPKSWRLDASMNGVYMFSSPFIFGGVRMYLVPKEIDPESIEKQLKE